MSKLDGALTLREIQLAALEIYERVASICAELGLRHWLMYGTLIGAVRHQGFIPWDDDLDIAMPRSDYNRLLAYFDEYAGELLPLVALHSTSKRPLPFLMTRISDMTYRMVGEYGDYVPELGTFIDVYPVDGLGYGKDNALRMGRRNDAYKRKALFARNFTIYNANCGPVKRVLKRARSMALGNPEKYESRLARSLATYDFDESEWCYIFWEGSKLLYRAEWLASCIPVAFEDTVAPIPEGFDHVLREYYGEYMQLPSEEDRVGHHHYSIVPRRR